MTLRRWLIAALIIIALAGFVVIAAGASVEARVLFPKQYERPPLPAPARPVPSPMPVRTVEQIERDAEEGKHPPDPWKQDAIIYWPDGCLWETNAFLRWLYGCG